MKKTVLVFIIFLAIVFGCLRFRNFQKEEISAANKLVFWTIQLKPIYEKEINRIIKEFESAHANLKIVWVDIPIAEAQKRTLASILSDTPPDLINLNPDFSVLLAQRGALETFSEEETKQYLPSLVEKLKYRGEIYALPFYATSSTTIYNKEIYDKCISKGFISSYDELFKISPDIKSCSNIAPFAANINENDTLAKILNKYDITSLKTKEQIEAAYKVYKMFDEMYKNNWLPEDVLTINHREMIEKYMSNQAAIIVAGSNFINMIKQNAPDIYAKSALSKQLTGSNGKYDAALMNLIIPKKAPNRDLAKEFAFILTNKENQLELSKLTNVLPANKFALQNDYFKTCSSDLVDKARCIAASQLDNLNKASFGEENKKTINEAINKSLEEILLNGAPLDRTMEQLSKEIQQLQQN